MSVNVNSTIGHSLTQVIPPWAGSSVRVTNSAAPEQILFFLVLSAIKLDPKRDVAGLGPRDSLEEGVGGS